MYQNLQFSQTTMANGLRVLYCHMPGAPWQYVDAVVHAGSFHDPAGKEGLAHFVEHVVNENGLLPTKERDKFFYSHGGGFNGGVTSFDCVISGFKLPAIRKPFQKGLVLLADLLFPLSMDKGVEKERSIILKEYDERWDISYRREMRATVQEDLHVGHPLSGFVDSLGTKASIAGITASDIAEFHAKYYVPGNVTLVVLGGLSKVEFFDALRETRFARIEGSIDGIVPPVSELPGYRQTERVFHLSQYLQRESIPTVADVGFNFHLPFETNAHALSLFKAIMDDVLFEELREDRQLVYSVRTRTIRTGGLWSAALELDSVNLDQVDAVCEVTLEALGRFESYQQRFKQKQEEIVAGIRIEDRTAAEASDEIRFQVELGLPVRNQAEHSKSFEALQFDDVLSLLEYCTPDNLYTVKTLP